MSGIITNPHFISYFHEPEAFKIGTMVAVLELGALGKFLSRLHIHRNLDAAVQRLPLPLVEWVTHWAGRAHFL